MVTVSVTLTGQELTAIAPPGLTPACLTMDLCAAGRCAGTAPVGSVSALSQALMVKPARSAQPALMPAPSRSKQGWARSKTLALVVKDGWVLGVFEFSWGLYLKTVVAQRKSRLLSALFPYCPLLPTMVGSENSEHACVWFQKKK